MMNLMMNLSNNIYSLNKIMDKLEEWNEQLDVFAAKHMDSPWFGMVIFIVLLVFGFAAIAGYMKNR